MGLSHCIIPGEIRIRLDRQVLIGDLAGYTSTYWRFGLETRSSLCCSHVKIFFFLSSVVLSSVSGARFINTSPKILKISSVKSSFGVNVVGSHPV